MHTTSSELPGCKLTLLLGAPRSGTSWLAKILDTYPRVFYSHEPSYKLAAISDLRERLKAGTLTPADRKVMLAEVGKAHHGSVRPPFFPKAFLTFPPAVRSAVWKSLAFLGHGKRMFARFFSPPPDGDHELLIKEVDWVGYVQQLVNGLRPDRLLIIVRNPCAVVSSRLKGVELGLMDSFRSDWLTWQGERCRRFGFTPETVEKMDLCRFFALNWLMQNTEYQEALSKHPRGTTVAYEDLCRDPHGTARALFAELGWTMPPQTTRFIAASTSGPVSLLRRALSPRSSYYGVYQDPTRTVDSWRDSLTDEQQRAVLEITSAFRLYRVGDTQASPSNVPAEPTLLPQREDAEARFPTTPGQYTKCELAEPTS
jgi:hypothetical protein